MFKGKRIIGLCLFLVVLFAPTAYAVTIVVNPGNVGGEAQNFNFANDDLVLVVDLVWADNKTLEWGAGTHVFLLAGDPGAFYAGILLDAAGNPIPGTELAGRVPNTADFKAGGIDLPETTVFSGIRLSSAAFIDAGGWAWNWNTADRPLVGETQASGNQAPLANAGADVTGEVGVAVVFDGRNSTDPDGSIVQYDWDFGDTTTGTGENPSHSYAAAGTYNVSLTVTDNDGLLDSDSLTATIAAVGHPPTANAGGPTYTGIEGMPVSFDGSLSSDPEGPIAQYDWDFGDNTTGTGSNPTHSYANNGEYTVILTVTDSDGETDDDSATATITIGNQAPTANAGPPAEGFLGDTVSFDGSLSSDPEGPIAQYDWDFGDNTTGTGVNPSHTYGAAGEYTVLLTVTDSDNVKDTAPPTAATIDANPLEPTADAGQPVEGTVNVAVDFIGSGSSDADGTIDVYSWDFGDGTTATGPNSTVSHPYAAAGSYVVTLTVTDNDGLTDTDNTQAAIDQANSPPTSDAGGPYAGAMGESVLLNGFASSDSDGSIVQYDWDHGDTTTGSGPVSLHTYTAPGSYTATLTVTDSDGDTDESNARVIIGDAAKLPPRPFTNGPYNGVAGVPLTFDGSNSTDPDGTINVYNWVFGDGNSLTGPTPDSTNTYVTGNLYSVLLQVTDNGGLTASEGTIARIGNLSVPPKAVANDEPYKGRVGVPVAFDGGRSSDPDGTIVSYDWVYGDGSIANDAGATPTHVYATGGKYLARLTVTDDSGETDTDATVVNVGIGNLPPVALAGDAVSGTVGNAISFNGSSSTDPDGGIAQYDWSFGDNTTVNNAGATPSHTYTTAGKYFVALTVTDSDSQVSSDVTVADVAPAASSGGGSSSGDNIFGCSISSREVKDPTLLLLGLFAMLYLVRRRAG